MGIAREQLIAEWRERLASAESAPAEGGARPAWLLRLRLRMYRFLLSIYGDGAWNAGEPVTARVEDDVAGSMIAAKLAATELEGKPAKGADEIRGVLTTFVKAQGAEVKPGPFVQGLPAESWIMVGACRGGVAAEDWLRMLEGKGLKPRVRRSGRRELIEVPLRQRTEAIRIMGELADERVQPRVVQGGGATAAWLAIAATIAMLSLILIYAVVIMQGDVGSHFNSTADLRNAELARAQRQAVWEGIRSHHELPRLVFFFVAMAAQVGLLVWLRLRRQRVHEKRAKMDATAASEFSAVMPQSPQRGLQAADGLEHNSSMPPG